MDNEIRFPVDISIGATAESERKTDIVTLRSGDEERNAVWTRSKKSFDLSTASQESGAVDYIYDFWEGLAGPKDTFRYKDWSDYKSCFLGQEIDHTDQIIGTGDGVTTQFQLIKTYGRDLTPYVRRIRKPVEDTVLMGVSGLRYSNFTVDLTTGMVTFGSAPASGAEITAGFEFDVRVRFADDRLSVTMDAQHLGGSKQIMLIEVP